MKIRQGKDIILRWKITTNGEALPLEGRNLALVLSTPNGRERVLSYTTEGDIISTHLFGKEITLLGDYTLTLWENRGEQGQTAVDAVNAFELVKYTTMEEDGSPCGNLEAEVLSLSGDLGVFQQGTTTEKNEQVDKNTADIADIKQGMGEVQEEIDSLKNKDAEQDERIASKQPLLTGDEFKTINGQSIMGEGDIEIEGGEGGRIDSEPTNAVIESIEPSLVSTALRKTAQVLTEDEKEQARKNIGAQKQLQLTVKDNGNIVLSNLNGQSQEFMPATPSGDPMHYAYEAAGAEYNATNDFDIKDAPWKDMVDTIEDKAKWNLDVVDASNVQQMTIKGVEYNYATENRTSPEGGTFLRYFLVGKGSNGVWVEDETKVLHLPKCWYLNGLGDITNAEMRSIYAVKHMSYAPGGGFSGTPCRTFIDRIKHTGSDLSCGDRYHRCKIVESIYSNVHRVANGGFNYAITSTTALRYFLPKVTLVSHKNKIFGAFGDASLRVLYIAGVQTAIQFPSKYISKASILYTINNVAPTLTSAITITLHHEAYERLKGDADILQALTTKNADLANTGDGKGKVSLVCVTDNETIPTE